MGGNGPGGSHHKVKHSKTRTESHRPRRQDSLEEGEIDRYEEYSTSSRRHGEQRQPSTSGGRPSQRSQDHQDQSQRNPTSPLFRHSEPGGVVAEPSSYFAPHPHHTGAQGEGTQDVLMGGQDPSSMSMQWTEQQRTHHQHPQAVQHDPFYSATSPYQPEQVQHQGQTHPPTYSMQMSSSPLPSPNLPRTAHQQYDDGQPRKSSYDAVSYGSSRQGTQGSVSSTSPEQQFTSPPGSGAGQLPSSHPMARSISEVAYRADASQAHLSATGGAPPDGYPSAYPSAGQQQYWPASSPYATVTTGDYTGSTREAGAPAYGTRMDVDTRGVATRPNPDPRYPGYASESPYVDGYVAGGTASRLVRPRDIPPYDSDPRGQPPLRGAPTNQYDDGMGNGPYPRDTPGGYSEGYTPAQGGQERPPPLRRDSRHTSSSSTETVGRDSNRDRDRNKQSDRDRHGDRRGEGSTDRREQHGDAYNPGRPRGSHSSRSLQEVDSALGPPPTGSRSGGHDGSYPLGIPEDWEGERGGGWGRREDGHGREYERDDRSGGGGYYGGALEKSSRRHHGGGGGSRRH